MPVVGDRARPPGSRPGRAGPARSARRAAGARSACFAMSTWALIASAWTPASVRPARVDADLLAGHAEDRLLDRLLDRRAMVLPLPAHERPAVIFDRQPQAGHGRIVPAGIAKPRSNSSGVIAAASGALDQEWARSRLRRRRWSGDRRAPPRPAATLVTISAASSLIRSPLTSNQAPGAGSKARTCRSTSSAGRVQSMPRLLLVDLGRVGGAFVGLRHRRDVGIGEPLEQRHRRPVRASSSVSLPGVLAVDRQLALAASARYRARPPSA